MRHILNIEYEYVRVYINSLALQAVVERCANPAGGTVQPTQPTKHQQHHLDPCPPTPSPGPSSSVVVTPQGGRSPQWRGQGGNVPFSTLAGLYGRDQGYVKEVVDASRNLLKTVVEGLLPGGYLPHAPVRTYFRIVSGAMFLLKVSSHCYYSFA